MVERLVSEHRELSPRLDEIEIATRDDPVKGVQLLESVRSKILRHAVEEEARIMRVIMKDAKSESTDSVKIMQEHRWVSEFLERRMDTLPKIQRIQAQNEIQKFVTDLRQHFKEEEDVVFPLALRALASEQSKSA